MMITFITQLILLTLELLHGSTKSKVCLAERITKSLPSYGRSLEQGVSLALEDQGKTNSVTLEKHYYDPLPLAPAEIVKSVISSSCSGVIGFGYLSDLNLAVKSLKDLGHAGLNGSEIPIFSTFSTSDETSRLRNVFQFGPPPRAQADLAVSFLKNSRWLHGSKPLIITEGNRDQMLAYRAAYLESFGKEGIRTDELVIHEGVSLPIAAISNKLVRSRVVIMLTGLVSSVEIINLQRSIDKVFIGTENFGSSTSPSLLMRIKKTDAKIFLTRHLDFSSSSKALEEFRNSYRTKFREEPTVLSAYGYDATKLIILSRPKKDNLSIFGKRFKYSGISGIEFENGEFKRTSNAVLLQVDRQGYKLVSSTSQ